MSGKESDVQRILSDPNVKARLDFLVEQAPRVQADFRWLAQRQGDLRRRYPGEWVFIQGERVVVHGPDHEELLKTVEDPGACVTWYIDPPGIQRIQTIVKLK